MCLLHKASLDIYHHCIYHSLLEDIFFKAFETVKGSAICKISMPMDVMQRVNGLQSSALNPNAPMFVPAAYRNVEDFSDQWWSLVHSSPSFRDYWLRECFSESLFDINCSDDYDSFLPDEDLFPVDGQIRATKDEEKEVRKDLILARLSSWRKGRTVSSPRLDEKAPKIVNVKVSPRPIHQPR